ncbi:hypothetical protein JVU11DRAFT_8952 [Chiua virens]|nr:hypothetical protein JVU11DRAFT_8952 [Chiua virens]
MTSYATVLKTWCTRVTRSRMTIAFFLFVLWNFSAQMTLHTLVLLGSTEERHQVSSAIDALDIQRGFIVVGPGLLEICSGIPTAETTMCFALYNGSAISTPMEGLSIECAEGLTWLENYLGDSKTQEVAYLVLETWLFVMSLIALLDESIPHLHVISSIVVLVAQVVNTSWISYRIVDNISSKHIYDEIVVDGTCGGYDILRGSWQYDVLYVVGHILMLLRYSRPHIIVDPYKILGCSIAALLSMLIFTFKLTKLYSKACLCSVGAPPQIVQSLKWRLWMRVFLQFATLFVLVSAALWYDKRKYDLIPPYSQNGLFDAAFYFVAIVRGTHSISTEKHALFLVHALMSIALLLISGLWFASALYRYEYCTWHFFTGITTVADLFLLITFVLSIICRLNFGKGLAHFLVVEKALRAAGFAQDTFLVQPDKSGGDVRQTMSCQLAISAPPSPPVVHLSRTSSETFEFPRSESSVQSSAFETWLTFHGKGDEEEGQVPIVLVGREKPDSEFVVSREGTRPRSVQPFFDEKGLDDDDDDKTLTTLPL